MNKITILAIAAVVMAISQTPVAAAPNQLSVVGKATVGKTTLVMNVNKKIIKVEKRPGRPGAGHRPNRPALGHRPHRPGGYRKWHRRPHYGRIIAGVALGAMITAAVAGTAPRPPSPDL